MLEKNIGIDYFDKYMGNDFEEEALPQHDLMSDRDEIWYDKIKNTEV